MDHFAQETCIDCDHNLIRIGGRLYILHDSVTCIKREVKSDAEIIEVNVDSEAFSRDDSNDLRKRSETQSNQQNSNDSEPNSSQKYFIPDIRPKAARGKNSKDTRRSACDICGKLVHTNSLQRHRRTMHSSLGSSLGQFECDICQMQFTKEHYLRQHVRLKHDSNDANKSSEPWDLDSDSGSDSDDVVEISEPPNTDPIALDGDEATTEVVGKDKRKRRRTNADNTCECELCGKRYHVNSLRRHKIVKHHSPDMIVCTMCCKILATPEELAEHTLVCISRRNNQNSRTIGKFQCELCDAVVSRQYSLRKHMLRKHPSEVKIPKRKPMKLASQPAKHKPNQADANRRDFVCHICGTLLGNAMALQRHEIVMHSEAGTNLCSNCMEKFDSAQELAIHRPKCLLRKNH